MKALTKLFLAGTMLAGTMFATSGCTYYMLYKAANYDYDDNEADRNVEEIERERTQRLVESGQYSDQEIAAINRNNSRSQKSMSIEELRAQQEKERAERARRKNQK